MRNARLTKTALGVVASLGIVAAGLVAAPAANAGVDATTLSTSTLPVGQTVTITANGSFQPGIGTCQTVNFVAFDANRNLLPANQQPSDQQIVQTSSTVTTTWIVPGAASYYLGSFCGDEQIVPTDVTHVKAFTGVKATPTASIVIPNPVANNTAQALTAIFAVPGQVTEPTGIVTFSIGSKVLGTSALAPSPAQGRSTASISWLVSQGLGAVTITATYGGDANFNATAATGSTTVASAQTKVSLTAPSTGQVGSPIQLVARVYPSSATGNVGFYIGTGNSPTLLGPPVTINGEVAVFNWTPTAPGAQTITAYYNGDAQDQIGSTSTVITISGQATADQITVDPIGAPPLTPGIPFQLGNGSSVQFQTSTLSGAPVTLSETGPCTINGAVLTAQSGSGTCTLTAKSPGGRGYAPASSQYVIQLVDGGQTANISAPNSGKVTKGSTLILAKSSDKTNKGNPISWKITAGASKCKLTVSGGKVKLKVNGKCSVRGSARGVPGSYGPYTVNRAYRV